MRSWSKPGKLTPRNMGPRPVPAGNPAGTGQNLTLNNPFGATLPSGPSAAPNVKPEAPSVLVQMGGQPYTGPATKKPLKPRSGDEVRQPDASSAPAVPVEELSPKDRTATAAHLASTVSGNLGHGAVHLKAAGKLAKRLKGPEAATMQHNLAHASKHVEEAAAHAEKLNAHLSKLPGVQGAVDELAEATPTDKPKRKAAKES